MKDLTLVKSENFDNTVCDFYKNSKDDILLTRTQIGLAMEYKNPNDAIRLIHERHKERIDKFSTVQIERGQEVYFYTAKGVYEICRWSRQPKANEFIDWAWEMIDKIRKNEVALVKQETLTSFKTEISGIVKNEVQKEIGKVENKCSTYYKPSCATKFSIGKYIKDRLGINKTNKEYDLVKQRIFIVLRAKKWEDIPMDVLSNSMKVVDESIDVIKKDRPYQQIDFFHRTTN